MQCAKNLLVHDLKLDALHDGAMYVLRSLRYQVFLMSLSESMSLCVLTVCVCATYIRTCVYVCMYVDGD